MAFDETLAARIRDALARRRNVEEKKTFGCICFFINGNALVGVWKDRLIAPSAPTREKRRCESRTSGRSTSPAGRCGIGWRSSRRASRTTTS
jgi:hypothetical protein